MKTRQIILTIPVLLMLAPAVTVSQELFDPLLPGKKRFNAGILATYSPTSAPPVLIGDLNYGISDKVSIGLVTGTTGNFALIGMKLNVQVLQREDQFRLMFRMISLYYPERDGPFLFDRENIYVMPWMLSMGVFDAEWKLRNGMRISAGLGLMETHCVADMKHWFMRRDKHHHSEDPEPDHEDHGFINVFNTVQAAVSIPLSRRVTLRPEIVAVLQGVKPVDNGEFKIRPFNPYLSVVFALGKRDH